MNKREQLEAHLAAAAWMLYRHMAPESLAVPIPNTELMVWVGPKEKAPMQA